MNKYKRILLKLSGEALMGEQKYGIDPQTLSSYASQIHEAAQTGLETGIVIGGGNIFRGVAGLSKGFDRVKGDYMGMLATVINGLALQSAIEAAGTTARVMTAVRMEPFAEFYSKTSAMEALKKKQVVIFTAGTGNPFFTTDTASALRAVEIEAEVMLKGTRVDGVYTADPEKYKDAVKFDEITFDEAIEKHLNILDLTAFALCKENSMPVIVFDMNKKGNLKRLISGEKIGTLVKI
ncbi:MAG: UMP kinase [Bacteroidales bacterium]|nr:UMP kinase [Bacteroidales bacterium]MCB8999820.1 UMP kinase [Bacteroidales bacterium]